MSRIIAVNRFYRPDHSASAQMLTDLMEHFVKEGAQATVVTSRLDYDGSVLLPSREVLGGVVVKRVWSSQFGRGQLLGRACDYATFYVAAFLELLKAKRGDIVIAKTDPPMISVVAALARRLKGFTLVNWCQDLFPEVAGALGFSWAGSWRGAVLRHLRNRSLRQAAVNVVLSAHMRDLLVNAGVVAEKIVILPNWCDADIQAVARTNNALRQQWKLGQKIVIGYSGNLGRGHMPDKIIDLVNRTRDLPNIAWLFVGGGAGLARVKETFAGAENILFQPYQPRNRLSESLSAADIHLIAQDPACEGLIYPSKLYGVLAVNRPILFLGSADADISAEITAAVAKGCPGGTLLDESMPASWRETVARLVDQCRTAMTNHDAPRTSKTESTPTYTARRDTAAKLVTWNALVRALQSNPAVAARPTEPAKIRA